MSWSVAEADRGVTMSLVVVMPVTPAHESDAGAELQKLRMGCALATRRGAPTAAVRCEGDARRTSEKLVF